MMGLLTLSALSIGFEGLLALRILFGLGMGLLFPATGSLVMRWFRGRQLPVINSMITGFASAAMVVAAATAAPLAGVMGWERVLGLFGAIGLAGLGQGPGGPHERDPVTEVGGRQGRPE